MVLHLLIAAALITAGVWLRPFPYSLIARPTRQDPS